MTSLVIHPDADNAVVLFRDQGMAEKGEEAVIRKHFPLITQRADVRFYPGKLIIPRYSCLPFFKEFETDVLALGGRLINSYQEHRYIADLQNWVEDLEGLTPRTWSRLQDIPEKGPFFLNGETNSLKHLWPSGCFAEDKRQAIEVARRCREDALLSTQTIYIREYVPLKTLMKDVITGMPITNEFRFFFYKTTLLSGAYYWSSHVDELAEIPQASQVPQAFLDKVIARVSGHATFFVVDVGQTESGDWIVVELNDGCMSGLSENNPDTLYTRLHLALLEDT